MDQRRQLVPTIGALWGEDVNEELYDSWPMILSALKTWLETGEVLTSPALYISPNGHLEPRSEVIFPYDDAWLHTVLTTVKSTAESLAASGLCLWGTTRRSPAHLP